MEQKNFTHVRQLGYDRLDDERLVPAGERPLQRRVVTTAELLLPGDETGRQEA